MYKMTLMDSDPDYVHTDIYPDLDSVQRGVAEVLLERIDGVESPNIVERVAQAIFSKDLKQMVKVFNHHLAEPANGDHMEVEEYSPKTKKPTYGNLSWTTIKKQVEAAIRSAEQPPELIREVLTRKEAGENVETIFSRLKDSRCINATKHGSWADTQSEYKQAQDALKELISDIYNAK